MAETQAADGAAPVPGATARRLIRACDRAVLATALADGTAWPYGSLVLTACDHGAAPLLLLSDLADHTKSLQADDRASLLFDGTGGLDDPLTGARASILGRLAKTDDPGHRARYLARHPSAGGYADFSDFNLYRMTIERAHLVAGFGRIHWLDATEVGTDATAALAEAEADIVAHMNDDHAEAVDLYARVLSGMPGSGWVMTGVDPEGLDLRLGGRTARLDFDHPVADAEGARAELVRLAGEARANAEAR